MERFFKSYIENRKSEKRAAFTNFHIMLSLALQNNDDYDSKLSKEIQRLIEICSEEAAN